MTAKLFGMFSDNSEAQWWFSLAFARFAHGLPVFGLIIIKNTVGSSIRVWNVSHILEDCPHIVKMQLVC